MNIFLAQLNPTVGDIAGNAAKIRKVWHEAAQKGADLVICAEMVLSGYPPDDLVFRPSFQEDVCRAAEDLATLTVDGGPALLIGAPWFENGHLYNAALLLDAGKIASKVFKHDLPNYGPFDDKRIFSPGAPNAPIDFRGVKIGVMICEDMWTSDVPHYLRAHGADLFVVLNGSPYETDKLKERRAIARARALENELPLVYVNLVGGQDELVFDGASFVMSAEGELKAQCASFIECSLMTEWEKTAGKYAPKAGYIDTPPEGVVAQYRAIWRGLQDYVIKNKFTDVILGLSGGIDSALVAVLAVDAFGADHVHAVMMPSVYTSRESVNDAMAVARALDCAFSVMPIAPAVSTINDSLAPMFGAEPHDITQQNIQSRCRGLMLMAMSNRFGHLLLATGNKSEMATGYATLYGDMCGSYAPLKDLYKTDVYKVARYAVQKNGPVIPEEIFTKAPTAELRPNQTDQDNLPPYDVLDEILRGLVERDMSFTALVEQGHDPALVERVWTLLQKSEYKRRQAPPGPKLTRRHLGKDRRYPITNGYTGS